MEDIPDLADDYIQLIRSRMSHDAQWKMLQFNNKLTMLRNRLMLMDHPEQRAQFVAEHAHCFAEALCNAWNPVPDILPGISHNTFGDVCMDEDDALIAAAA